jgi:hypothetical protein
MIACLCAHVRAQHRHDKRLFIACYQEIVDKAPTEGNYVLLGEAYMKVQMPTEATAVRARVCFLCKGGGSCPLAQYRAGLSCPPLLARAVLCCAVLCFAVRLPCVGGALCWGWCSYEPLRPVVRRCSLRCAAALCCCFVLFCGDAAAGV